MDVPYSCARLPCARKIIFSSQHLITEGLKTQFLEEEEVSRWAGIREDGSS